MEMSLEKRKPEAPYDYDYYLLLRTTACKYNTQCIGLQP